MAGVRPAFAGRIGLMACLVGAYELREMRGRAATRSARSVYREALAAGKISL